MNKEIPKTVLETSFGSTMELVLKKIYSSCDPNGSNKVPTTELIEYIRPYMLQDLSALETLRNLLDPENENKCIGSEHFNNVMDEWAKKLTTDSNEESDEESNSKPSHLNVNDEKLLPLTQSTPRRSFGQKLLSCQDLLDLSNVSSYNSSANLQTKDNSLVSQEKTMLEEEIKQLQYKLNKVLEETGMLKLQLAYAENENESLHDELKKIKTRLQSEHQVNGHMQDNGSCIEDMKEEINLGEKRIEELNQKLLLFEKDNHHLNMYVQKLEKENSELDDRCGQLNKTEQNLKKQLIDVNSLLVLKENDITSLTKINENLTRRLYEKESEVDQLLNENELLDYKKQGLEKFISSRRYSLSTHYNTCLDEMSSFFTRGSTIPIYSSPLKNQSYSYHSSSPSLIKTVLSPISPNPDGSKSKMLYKVLKNSTPKTSNGLGLRKAFSLNTMSTRSLPNVFCFERSVVQDQSDDVGLESLAPDSAIKNGPYESLQMELFQVDPQFDHKNGAHVYEEEINNFKSEIQSLQDKLKSVIIENEILSVESKTSSDKLLELELTVQKLMLEKKSLEECVSKIEENKTESNKLIKYLESTIGHLKDENKKEIVAELKTKFDFDSACVIEKLDKDLHDKTKQVGHLKEILKNEQDIKNKMWNDNQDLTNRLKSLTDNYEKVFKEVGENDNIIKQLKEDYNTILIKYNKEVIKNEELLCQVSSNNSKYQEISIKYHDQLNTNLKFREEVSYLKSETESIKENYKNYKNEINKLTVEYQNSLQLLNSIKIKNCTFDKQKLTIDRLKEKLENLERDFRNERIKNEILNKKIHPKEETSNLQIVINELLCKKNELLETNEGLSSEINTLQSVINDMRSNELETNKRFGSEINGLQAVINDIRTNKEELLETNERLISEINTLQSVINDMRSNEKELLETNKRFGSEINVLKSIINDIRANKEELLETNERLTSEINTLQSVINDMRSNKEELLETNKRSSSEINTLKAIINDLKSNEEQLLEINKQFSSENNIFQTVINDLKDKIKQQEEKNIELSLNFSQLDDTYRNALLINSQKEMMLQRKNEMIECNNTIIANLKLFAIYKIKASTSAEMNLNLLAKDSAFVDLEQELKAFQEILSKTDYDKKPVIAKIKRPVSPDSPGIEIEPEVNEKFQCSPDSQNCRSFNFNVEGEDCAHNSSTNLPHISFDLKIEDAFPHMSDKFLDKLGLHENSPRVTLTEEETEDIFTTFAIQLALDSKDIRDRLKKQKELCSKQYRKVLNLLKGVSVRLKDHKCTIATDSINPIFGILEDVCFQMQEMMQAVGQLGILTCGNHMTRCWNLVTNYMAIIRQNSENCTKHSFSNKSSTECVNPTDVAKKGLSLESSELFETQDLCDNVDKEAIGNKKSRSCCSRLAHSLIWLSFIPVVFFIGFIFKMNSESHMCSMGDIIKVWSAHIGEPPY